MSVGDGRVEDALRAAAEEADARIASCHERVACPKCHAPVGLPCRRALRQFVASGIYAIGQPVVGPHRERWTLVQAER